MKPHRSTRIPARASCPCRWVITTAALALALLVASPAFAGPLVAIDAGHGGPYNHARYGSLTEKAATLLFALELGAQLQQAGYGVAYTRTTDTAVSMADLPTWHWIEPEARWSYVSDGVIWYGDGVPRDDLQARSDVANRLGADVFISIHCNGASSSSARGTENWASANDPLGQELGRYVQGAVLEQTRQRDRGAGVQSFYVTKWANMPALLIETGFMSNPTEGRQIATPSWRSTYVRGIVNGLNRWMSTNPYRAQYPRYAGASGSSAAVAVSRSHWAAGGAPVVVLASLYDPASAFAAPLATARLGAPLLFAEINGLSSETTAELARLRPARIIALGSVKMLPDAFLAQAAAAAGLDPAAVTRLSGTEAADVASLLSEEVVSTETSMTVIFANSARTTDAISAASVAAARGAALVLTRADGSLPPEAVAFLASHSQDINAAVSVGAVPDSASQGLPNRTRIGGSEPYATAIAAVGVARPSGSTWLVAYNPASGADSVAAATLAARNGWVALPVDGRVLSPLVREWIENSAFRLASTAIVGDFGTLPPLAEEMITKARL